MANKKYERTHYFTIYSFLSKYIWVLLIPILQSLILKPQTLSGIIASYGINILVLFILISFSITNYGNLKYVGSKNSFNIKKGIIIKRTFYIPYSSIHSIIIEKNIIPSIFGAERLQVITPSKKIFSSYKSLSLSLFLKKEEILETVEKIYGNAKKYFSYKSNHFKIVLMSATWSNSLTGLLVLAPFIKNIGNIFGDQYSKIIYNNFDLSSYIILRGLPPLSAAIASVLILSWAAAFIILFFRYYKFSTKVCDNRIIISRGLINKNLFITEKNKINCLTIKQSILMQVFNFHSLYLHTIGTGFQKSDKSLLVPAEKEKVINKTINEFIKIDNKKAKKTVKPKHAGLSYILPALILFSILVVLYIILEIFSAFTEIIHLAYLFAIPLTILWMFFRYRAYQKSAILLGEQAVEIKYFSRLNLTHSIIPYERIQFARISQSPFQRYSKRCNLTVNIYSINSEKVIIKHIDLKDGLKVMKKLSNYVN